MSPHLLPGSGCVKEPQLTFGNGTDVHPLKGLLTHKAADSKFLRKAKLRIAVIKPMGETRIDQIFSRLQTKFVPTERKDYLKDFTGFTNIFGLEIQRVFDYDLTASLFDDLAKSKNSFEHFANILVDAVTALKMRHADFDVLIIYIPRKLEPFIRKTPTDRYLHDFIKGVCAEAFIPLQIIREGGALDYSCQASVMWRLSIALYTKAGGIPWKIANYDKGKAFIGISYAMRKREQAYEYVTCCSQMFDPDGTGFEFVAYEIEDYESIKENPYLTREEMFKVMSRSLSLYQDRHNGIAPKKITIHKQTPFTEQEIDGCFEAFPDNTEIELLQISRTPWFGINLPIPLKGKNPEEVKKALGWPVERGTYCPIGESECLLWIKGNVNGRGLISDYSNYYKEQIGYPRPLSIKRFAGDGGWHETCLSIIGLTKMDWNNDALYDDLPVTLSYSHTLAEVIKHMPTLARQTYQYRLFM